MGCVINSLMIAVRMCNEFMRMRVERRFYRRIPNSAKGNERAQKKLWVPCTFLNPILCSDIVTESGNEKRILNRIPIAKRM